MWPQAGGAAMKKKVMAHAVLVIAFALFNVIAFAIPTEKTATFWIAYAFSVVAFAMQIGIWKFSFKGADTLKSKFLGIPLIFVGIAYLIVQIIAFAIFVALNRIKRKNLWLICDNGNEADDNGFVFFEYISKKKLKFT